MHKRIIGGISPCRSGAPAPVICIKSCAVALVITWGNKETLRIEYHTSAEMVAGRQLRHLAKRYPKMLQTLKIVAQPSKTDCRTGVSFAVSFSAKLSQTRRDWASQAPARRPSKPPARLPTLSVRQPADRSLRLPVAQLSPFRGNRHPTVIRQKPATTGDRVGFYATPQRSPAQIGVRP